MSELREGAPRLTVCLLTYNRFDYAITTMTSCLRAIVHDGIVNLHIADDGSPPDYVPELIEHAMELARRGHITGQITSSNSERNGYGSNYNLAMQTIHDNSDLVLPLEDDWEAVDDVPVSLLAKLFEDDDRVGCIRLGYLSFTQPLVAQVIASNNFKYLLLDGQLSNEPHVFTGHPRLETVKWEKEVGPWPENLPPGETEFYVSTKLARSGIVWPMDLTRSCGEIFHHIGSVRSY